MKIKKKSSISQKAAITIILFTLLISILICIGGAVFFDRAMEKSYNERGYIIANIILDQLDHERIARYANTWEKDSYYDDMSRYLQSVQEYTGAAYIYIGVPYEDKTIRYIYDSGSEMGFVDPIAAPFDEIWRAYTEGVKPESYLVRRSLYGFLTSSCLPIRDSEGNVAALLFVDTDMEEILSTLRGYIINTGIIVAILLVIFCILNWYFLNRSLLHPLLAIRKHVMDFVSSGAKNDHSLDGIRTGDEMEELARAVNLMEDDLVAYIEDIRAITAEKERIGTELELAKRIQMSQLPMLFPAFPERDEFDIYAFTKPAKEVGGDFYDFFFVDDDHFGMMIADVAGKGIPASLIMMVSKALIKSRLKGGESPGETLSHVNNQLLDGAETDMFVTVWLAVVEISTGRGKVSNAGHEHPAIRRKDGGYEYSVYRHSPPVGSMSDIVFKEHEFELKPGDSIFVYTDGVTEATSAETELLGEHRLLEALNREPGSAPKKTADNVMECIDGFVRDAEQFDDITMLVFLYRGKQNYEAKR